MVPLPLGFREFRAYNIDFASLIIRIIRIRFRGPLYYNYTKDPPPPPKKKKEKEESFGNSLGPYIMKGL